MADQPPTSLRDWGISLIRTGVPILWGNLLVFLATRFPALDDFLHQPQVVGGGALITSAVALAWYAAMRKLEPHLPPWLTVLVLGANATPVYTDTAVESWPEARLLNQADRIEDEPGGHYPPTSRGL